LNHDDKQTYELFPVKKYTCIVTFYFDHWQFVKTKKRAGIQETTVAAMTATIRNLNYESLI